jgi:hypothetical protein
MLAAIGWDRIVGKTPNDVLIKVLDAFAQKVSLVAPAEEAPFVDDRQSSRMTPVPAAHPADVEDSTLHNANAKRAGTPIQSIPTAAEVDQIFNESVRAPAQDDNELIVVDDDLEINAVSTEGRTTNRPAAEEPMMLKPRSVGSTPPVGRRR